LLYGVRPVTFHARRSATRLEANIEKFLWKNYGKERGMLIKVLAGIVMGFATGAASKGFVSMGEAESSFRSFAVLAVVSSLAFVIYTFVAYNVAFGFAAIGEVFVGAVCAGFLTRQGLVMMTNFSPILLILGWIMAVA
jgi:hypothetical protein